MELGSGRRFGRFQVDVRTNGVDVVLILIPVGLLPVANESRTRKRTHLSTGVKGMYIYIYGMLEWYRVMHVQRYMYDSKYVDFPFRFREAQIRWRSILVSTIESHLNYQFHKRESTPCHPDCPWPRHPPERLALNIGQRRMYGCPCRHNNTPSDVKAPLRPSPVISIA